MTSVIRNIGGSPRGKWQLCHGSAPSARLLGLALLSVALSITACAANRASTGAFRDIAAIETRLQRQSSTKSDVEKLLGAPDGYGGATLPFAPAPRDVWFYQDIGATDAASRAGGIVEMKLRQQILLVFFQGGLFDGFMWYSTAIPALSKTQ